jgi:hypothetical protein
MRTVCLAVLCGLAASAQVIGPSPGGPGLPISPDLRVHLELTGEQLGAMNRLNAELWRFQSEKARRAAQVQMELQDERQKDPLDPMAIGLRYVELEAIQRELMAKARETAAEVRKVFTPAQQAKLQSLVEVLRMYPLACEAASLNLITPPETRWFNTGSFISPGIGAGNVGGIIYGGPSIGCVGLPGIRTELSPVIPR